MYPYTYVTGTQAKKLAEQVESGNCTSNLMFGIQWDLVLKFIEEKIVEQAEKQGRFLFQKGTVPISKKFPNPIAIFQHL